MRQTANADMADVIIVGGGIVGCTTGYNLAKRGARVVLIEKEDIAQEASGRNRGNVRLQLRNRLELPIALEAIEMWKRADEELGFATEYRTTGNLLVIGPAEAAVGWAEPKASFPVSMARKYWLVTTWPTGMPSFLKASPISLALARPASLSWRCLSTLAKLSGSVSAWS